MATSPKTALPTTFPANATLGSRGASEVAGCDLEELAHSFGTPAYVVDEEELRARARAYLAAAEAAFAGRGRVAFAAKAFPATPVLALFAEEGLYCDVASGGELELALAAGFAPERLILVDNADELKRLAALAGQRAGGAVQPVLLRATPAVAGKTHAKISTGQADSKFGFSLEQLPAAIERAQAIAGLQLR